MLGFGRVKKQRYASTFKTVDVEYLGVTYTIREMNTAERIVISAQAQEGKTSALAVYAQIVASTCLQFADVDKEELVLNVSPTALEFLATESLKLSGMGKEAEEEIEKKSLSSQKPNSLLNSADS